MIKPTVFVVAALFSIVSICLGAGPSFDCQKASTAIEKAICASEKLSELDENMSVYFNTAKKIESFTGPDGATDIKRNARSWLKKRSNLCKGKKNEELDKCLFDLYEKRISYLKKRADESSKEHQLRKLSRIKKYKNILPSLDVSDREKYKAAVTVLKWYSNTPIKYSSGDDKELFHKFVSGEGVEIIEPADRSFAFSSDLIKLYQDDCPGADFFIKKGPGRGLENEDTSTWREEDWAFYLKASEDLRIYLLTDLKSSNQFYGLYANKYKGRLYSREVTLDAHLHMKSVGPSCSTFYSKEVGFSMPGDEISLFGFFKLKRKLYFYYLQDSGNCSISIYEVSDMKVKNKISISYFTGGVK